MYQSTYDKLKLSKNFEKIVYWIDTWEDLFNNFDNYYGLELVNPHLILIDIKNEIQLNKLKNKKNVFFFKKKISNFIKFDPVIKGDYKSDFILIIKELDLNRPEYFLELCNAILDDFKKGEYFYKTIEKLERILLNPTKSDDDFKLIYYLSQNLIVEFILKGFSLKTIRSFPENIFDDYTIIEGKFISTKFPHGIEINGYKKGNSWDYETYSKIVSEKIQQLSVEDRIKSIKNYYYIKPDQGNFIFQIEGLVGKNEINIGNVCFYSPLNKKYITNKSRDLEFFGAEKPIFMNAVINLRYIDVENAKDIALERINSALDVIKLFRSEEDPIVINKYHFLICQDGNIRYKSDSISPRDSLYQMHHSLNLDKFNLQILSDSNLEHIIKNISLIQILDETPEKIFVNKIVYSLHWYRKALETTILEDKLLNFWIVLEGLVTFEDRTNTNVLTEKSDEDSKLNILEEIIPAIEIDHLITRIGEDLYASLYREVNSFTDPPNTKITLSQKTIDICHLSEENPAYNLGEFIQNIPSVLGDVGNIVYKNKIETVSNFYNDNIFAQKVILKQNRKIKDDLLLIYRLRNFIVHNANFDNYLLPYYTDKASIYSGNLLREIIYRYTLNPNKTQIEIIVERKVKLKRMIEKLKENSSLKVLDLNKSL
jgi:hypothetical protein